MNHECYSIVMPMYGHSHFVDLAVKSIARHSSLKPELVLIVEPANTIEDEKWLESLPSIWKHPLQIIRNQNRLGYYSSVNKGVLCCKTDTAVIFTTDQVAAPDWDRLLLQYLVPKRFVTGRLIESGANLIADGNIWKNFGYDPASFDELAFVTFCRDFKSSCALDIPRHYIPMAFLIKDFVDAGMFRDVFDTGRAKTEREDFYFFIRSHKAGVELAEVQQPLTYHFQSGSRKGRFNTSFLNYIYPYGLKHIHRMLTGYVSLYDALKQQGIKRTPPDSL